MLDLINWRSRIRERVGAVVAALAGSAGCCACGLLMALVLAPRQALQATGIAGMPVMGPAEVAAAAPGEAVLITGVLDGNPPALDDSLLVVYRSDVWEVRLLESGEGDVTEPSGRWQSQTTRTPALLLAAAGATLPLDSASGVQLGGDLRETLVLGESDLVDTDQGTPLPDGTVRYRGLADGDTATVLGDRSSAGGIVPEHIFAGDRAAFEASQRTAAGNLLTGGLCLIGLAPVVLVGGVGAALLGRRRR